MPISFDTLAGLIPSDPLAIARIGVLSVAFILIFLLLFTLRDILLRTRSFWYQCFCVLLVGALPVVGFLLYLLIRPARTVKQRETDNLLRNIFMIDEDEELDSAMEDGDDMPSSEDDDVIDELLSLPDEDESSPSV